MSQTDRVAALLGESRVVQAGKADVSRIRERSRRRRLLRVAIFLALLDAFLFYRAITHNPIGLPGLPSDWVVWMPVVLLILLFGVFLMMPLMSGRSPHVMIRPEHIETGLSDVRGLDGQVDEVVRSLNVFLGYATFREVLGGSPRRGILFEGPPGTGKTFLAKAMAKQAGVPFLFVAAPAFQSMWFGMTNTKIRSFFRSLRRAARREGGAIGFIEEIDAIGVERGALSMSPAPVFGGPAPGALSTDGAAGGLGRVRSAFGTPATGGMVNELLIQMQSFDQPGLFQRTKERLVEVLNGYLPEGRKIRAGKPKYHNILLIAATNRADALDAALLRPGRFDRRLYFDLPTKHARRELIDYFLDRKAHHGGLDRDEVRDRLAQDTFGYTPVMVEHLLDEGLLVALRGGRHAMTAEDVYEAKLTEEIGIRQPVIYTPAEREAVATHEAGHAVTAHLLGNRRMEVLSIIKRRSSLGLLAHSDLEERFTRSRSEMEGMMAIALGGMAAEETFFGESGTGPGSDLSTATEIAATMVGALGMAGSLISFEAVAESPVSRRNLVGRVLDDPEAKARVDALLHEQKQRVRGLLFENRDLVEALRDALVEHDELVGEEITRVIREAELRRRGMVDLTETNGSYPTLADLTGRADPPPAATEEPEAVTPAPSGP